MAVAKEARRRRRGCARSASTPPSITRPERARPRSWPRSPPLLSPTCAPSRRRAYSPCEAIGQVSLRSLPPTPTQFLTIAKLRAARRLIWRIAEASGAGEAAAKMHLTAVSSRAHDGQARSVDEHAPHARSPAPARGSAAPTRSPCCRSRSRSASRTASRGASPATSRSCCRRNRRSAACSIRWAGSWYIEKLTDDLATKAWSLFQDIEAKGGIISALGSGELQAEIAAMAEARAKAIATGRAELTGVSAFPLLGDDGVKVTSPPGGAGGQGKADRDAH